MPVKSRMKICEGCGCTDDAACPGGCSWVSLDPPICSACVDDELDGGIGDATLLSQRGQIPSGGLCPASFTPAAHKPLWLSETRGHCAACRQPFFAEAVA